jgi:membrane-associated phospholipid phosphatase
MPGAELMAGSEDLARTIITELITESGSAEIALLGIALSVFTLLTATIAPWLLRRSHDPFAESRCFATLRWTAVVALFIVLTQQVQEMGWLTGADTSTLRWFTSHRSPTWTHVAVVVSGIGSPLGVSLIASGAGGLYTWRFRNARAALVLLVTLSFAAAANSLTKLAVGRLRPPIAAQLVHTQGFAYPSGHTAGTTALAGAILIIGVPATAGVLRHVLAVIVTLFGVIAVAASRLYLGVHWLTDVAGGVLIGAAVVLTVAVFVHSDVQSVTPTEEGSLGAVCGRRQSPPTMTSLTLRRTTHAGRGRHMRNSTEDAEAGGE